MISIEERLPKEMPGESTFFISFNYNKDIVDYLKKNTLFNYNPKTKEWEIPVEYLSSTINALSVIDDVDVTLMEEKKHKHRDIKLGKFNTKPFDYQLEGIDFGVNKKDNWLLLDPPGLGKTLQTIYIAQELYRAGLIEHCLIICGINTLKTNWKAEIKKHSNLSCRILGERKNKKGKTVIGSVQERLEQLQDTIKEFFVITNVETLRNKKIVSAINKGKNKFDFIVVDEIHVAKSCTSQQGENLLKLNKAKFKLGLTGTLLLNKPEDAHLPLKWLGIEKSSLSRFKDYYYKYGGPFGDDFIGYQHMDTLKEELANNSLRREKSILNLPDKNLINEIVEMEDDQKKFYENLVAGVVSEVDKVKISTASLLAMLTRLRQATVDPSILTTEKVSASKLDRAEELVREIVGNGSKVVVFSNYKQPLYTLQNRLNDISDVVCTGDIDDATIQKNVLDFQNNSEIKVFLGTMSKCGTGINLYSATHMIFLDLPWTYGSWTQCQDRIYRIGTKEPVFIYNLMCADSVDEKVYQIVSDKQLMSEYIIDNKVSENLQSRLLEIITDLKEEVL